VAIAMRRFFWLVSFALIVVGVAFAGFGTFTLEVQDWTNPFLDPGSGTRHVPAANWLPAFQAFALVCLVW